MGPLIVSAAPMVSVSVSDAAQWLAAPPRPLRLGVLISGGGRTLLNLLNRQVTGDLHAQITGMISSRPQASDNSAAFDRCAELGIPTCVIEPRQFPNASVYGEAQAQQLDAWQVDLVCLAGYLKLWLIPARYSWRVLNIHPTLLPKFGGKGFYGDRAHQAVLAAGETVSGCTVHFADNIFDHGPILVQRQVPVLPSDSVRSLAARVFSAECLAFPSAINLIAAGLVRITPDGMAAVGPYREYP